MRPVQLILISLFGGLAVYLEFRNIKEWTPFGGNILDNVPFFALCLALVGCIFQNIRQYRRTNSLVSFLPFTMGFALFALTLAHNFLRSHHENLPTLFTATNYDIGTDGGFRLHFKKDDFLVGEKINHFSTTTYWGEYKRSGDTIVLDIPLDFKMGRQAVLQSNVLRFLDDTVKFEVSPY